jgi:hypothetical protein
MDSHSTRPAASPPLEKPHIPQKPAASPKIDREQARRAILAIWPSWSETHLGGRTAKDKDAHDFLRFVRQNHPELFQFKSRVSQHETAFLWLLDARLIAC